MVRNSSNSASEYLVFSAITLRVKSLVLLFFYNAYVQGEIVKVKFRAVFHLIGQRQ